MQVVSPRPHDSTNSNIFDIFFQEKKIQERDFLPALKGEVSIPKTLMKAGALVKFITGSICAQINYSAVDYSKEYQFAILDNQDLRVVNRVPISIKRELTENCVKISNIRECLSN